MPNQKILVIVESPAKAKTIAGYLGPDYTVTASVGHIRDMPKDAAHIPAKYKKEPWARLGINIEDGFQPIYVVDDGKKSLVTELKRHLKDADLLLLATDEDREGEAIAWHLLEVLKPKIPVARMVFHEITEAAIQNAADNTRELDMKLVNAQECRRIVDRLYGFEISPVLWKKIAPRTSAGRVQSVAMRLIVQREEERIAFRPAHYWSLTAALQGSDINFSARLTAVDGDRVASGRDFTDAGVLSEKSKARILAEDETTALMNEIAHVPFSVSDVESKPYRRSPAAPFMTSTLQQEASRKLRWGAQRTMSVAQGLYERGFITYMRTDSTTLSASAVAAARRQAGQLYGQDHVSETPRRYDRKVKNAQEAHEAIRPAGDDFRTPGQAASHLNTDERALYDLIWKRTIASQMADARGTTNTLRIRAVGTSGTQADFTASGTVITFPGFQAAYSESRDEDDPADKSEKERRLPPLAVGDAVTLHELTPEGHQTKPPARYTEATLVRALEERGIGRPSTYASIIETIQKRGYVWKRGSALVPAFLAFAVNRLLENSFTDLVNYSFTARMEEALDQVAAGNISRNDLLNRFYYGSSDLPVAQDDNFPGLQQYLKGFDEIDARANATFPVGDTDIVVRVGRFGPYVQQGEQRASVPTDLPPDELTPERAQELLDQPSGDRDLGTHPESGYPIVAKAGRFGPYVTEVLPEELTTTASGAKKRNAPKPKTASLFADMSLDTVTMDDAVKLLSLPREVGVDPTVGDLDDAGKPAGLPILAQNGRYGPYLTRGSETRSLESEEQIFTVTLEQAQQLFAEPKRRRGAKAAAPVTVVGVDPTSGKEITLREGRFGPYVTDGEINASLRVVDDPATIGLERAADLIAQRRAKGPDKKRAKKTTKKAAKKTTKTAAKKTAKKAAVKKATAG